MFLPPNLLNQTNITGCPAMGSLEATEECFFRTWPYRSVWPHVTGVGHAKTSKNTRKLEVKDQVLLGLSRLKDYPRLSQLGTPGDGSYVRSQGKPLLVVLNSLFAWSAMISEICEDEKEKEVPKEVPNVAEEGKLALVRWSSIFGCFPAILRIILGGYVNYIVHRTHVVYSRLYFVVSMVLYMFLWLILTT